MKQRSGLGKGLSSLISTEGFQATPGSIKEIPIGSIVVNQQQPRKYFDEELLVELASSMAEVGLLQPIIVRPVENGLFELIAGERRVRAAKRLGWQTILSIIQEASNQESLERALIENLQRANLNPIEEAHAYLQLCEQFNLTHDEVALKVGKSRAAVSNAIRLLQLPESIQRLVYENKLSSGHARALLSLTDRTLQENLAQRCVNEEISVRKLEDIVREIVNAHSEEKATDNLARTPKSSNERKPTGFLELESLLSDRLNTVVHVQHSGKKGKLVIEFADIDDLERIYRLMFS